jgi:hypothetical protein
MVEAGYDRTISPGQPTTANFGYFPDPIAFLKNIPVAIMTGVDNGLQDVGAGRPMQTDRPDIGPGSTGQGAYGIGGPLVTMSPTTNELPLTLASPAAARIDTNDPVPQANTPPQQPKLTETTSNSSNGGPRLNVLRLPLLAVPGQTGTAGTDSSQPKTATSVKSGLSTVTQSIKAVTTAIKDVANSLRPKKASDSAPAADAPAA